MKKIEIYLRNEINDYTNQEKKNLKLHIAMVAVMKLLKKMDYNTEDLTNAEVDDLTEDIIDDACITTIELSRKYKTEYEYSVERLAKTKKFVDFLKTNIDVFRKQSDLSAFF